MTGTPRPRRRAKAAVWHVAAIWVSCPECAGAIENVYGSQMITEDDWHAMTQRGTATVTCPECDAEVRLPKWPTSRSTKEATR